MDVVIMPPSGGEGFRPPDDEQLGGPVPGYEDYGQHYAAGHVPEQGIAPSVEGVPQVGETDTTDAILNGQVPHGEASSVAAEDRAESLSPEQKRIKELEAMLVKLTTEKDAETARANAAEAALNEEKRAHAETDETLRGQIVDLMIDNADAERRISELITSVVDAEFETDKALDENELLTDEKRGLEEEKWIDQKYGLPNGAALERALQNVEQDPSKRILQIDIGNFGNVNKFTEFGEDRGDDELRYTIACLLVAGEEFGVAERDIIRKGGDELTVIVNNDSVDLFVKDPTVPYVSEGRKDAFINGEATGYSEYFKPDKNAPMVYVGKVPRAEAVMRRAQELFGHHVFVGHYEDKGKMSNIVTLAGSHGNTFKEAEQGVVIEGQDGTKHLSENEYTIGVQRAKAAVKQRTRELYPELAAIEFTKEGRPQAAIPAQRGPET